MNRHSQAFCEHSALLLQKSISKGGVPLRTAQAAMRHSDPKLTANVYTDPRLLDVAGALEVLPDLPLDGPRDVEPQVVTGTAGPNVAPENLAANLAVPLAETGVHSCQEGATTDRRAKDAGERSGGPERHETHPPVQERRPVSIADKGRAGRGGEIRTRDLLNPIQAR